MKKPGTGHVDVQGKTRKRPRTRRSASDTPIEALNSGSTPENAPPTSGESSIVTNGHLPEHWPARLVVVRRIADLIPYARNARIHSDAQVAQIAASMREWGWTIPMLIDERENLIAGHGRILAADLLSRDPVEAPKWEYGPCVVAAGWSESKKRAYVIADNKLALNASWDQEFLRLEVTDLIAAGYATDLTGFTVGELDTLLTGWNYEMQSKDIAAGADLDVEVIKLKCRIGEKETLKAILRAALDSKEYTHVTIS